jgi:predicted signal transduction protein with EAL and GGDEF domain
LRRMLRPSDTVARLGGDEFIIVCETLDDEADIAAVAERIASSLAAPFIVDAQEIFLSASIGIATTRDHLTPPQALITDADTAMYRVKAGGRSGYTRFQEAMRLEGEQRLAVHNDLRHAVARGELRVHYQPEVSLEDRLVVGVEALIRWEHPACGLLQPAAFIPFAEESGLISSIGAWVLEEACAQLSRWGPRAEGITLAVNLSAKQLLRPELADDVASVLHETGIAPDRLCLEITESAVMEDPDAAVATLARLKALGVILAIDDFGVGLSSLGRIRELAPADVIKIDRSFISRLGASDRDSAIVGSVISLANSLGMTAVAEGVETAAQASELQALGCRVAQGFHFAHPQPAESAIRFVEDSRVDLRVAS